MDTSKLVLLGLVLVLGITAFLFAIQYRSAASQLDRATITSRLTLELLRNQGVPCSAQASEFSKVETCLTQALLVKDFKEDGFAQPDQKKGTPGYLVIKNANRKQYNASDFVFQFNREIIQEGCTIPGTIDYNTACRFNFPNACEKGSVLEVFYNSGSKETKIFSKNC